MGESLETEKKCYGYLQSPKLRMTVLSKASGKLKKKNQASPLL
jgi:hypothetical protein